MPKNRTNRRRNRQSMKICINEEKNKKQFLNNCHHSFHRRWWSIIFLWQCKQFSCTWVYTFIIRTCLNIHTRWRIDKILNKDPILAIKVQTGNGVRVVNLQKVLQKGINSHCLHKTERGVFSGLLKGVSRTITSRDIGVGSAHNSPPIIESMGALHFRQWQQWNTGGGWWNNYNCCHP